MIKKKKERDEKKKIKANTYIFSFQRLTGLNLTNILKSTNGLCHLWNLFTFSNSASIWDRRAGFSFSKNVRRQGPTYRYITPNRVMAEVLTAWQTEHKELSKSEEKHKEGCTVPTYTVMYSLGLSQQELSSHC